MPSEQIPTLSKFAWLTVATLILIGGTRLVINVRGFILFSDMDEEKLQAQSIETCERVFADGESDRPNDRIQSEHADPPVPSIVPLGQSRCQTWVKRSQQIGDSFFIWHMVLWFVGTLLGAATLFGAYWVVKKKYQIEKFMLFVFVIQLFAAVGEVSKVFLKSSQGKEIILVLWPDLEKVSYGWTFLYGEVLMATVSYTILCLVYLGLVMMVRSKKMWV